MKKRLKTISPFIAILIFLSCNNKGKSKPVEDTTIEKPSVSFRSQLMSPADSAEHLFDSTFKNELDSVQKLNVANETYDLTLPAATLRNIYGSGLPGGVIGLRFSWYDKEDDGVHRYSLWVCGVNATEQTTPDYALEITFPGQSNHVRRNSIFLGRRMQTITTEELARVLEIPTPLTGTSQFEPLYFMAKDEAHPPSRTILRRLLYLAFRKSSWPALVEKIEPRVATGYTNPCPPCTYCVPQNCDKKKN